MIEMLFFPQDFIQLETTIYSRGVWVQSKGVNGKVGDTIWECTGKWRKQPYSTDKKKIIKKAYPYTSWEPEQFHPLLGGKGVGCRVKNIVGGSNINLSASYIGI